MLILWILNSNHETITGIREKEKKIEITKMTAGPSNFRPNLHYSCKIKQRHGTASMDSIFA